jgi:Lon protease-like protein
MIMPPRAGQAGQTEYGTMLEIRNVQMLADGRSMVETFGAYCFRILERGTLDGYMVGRVERIDDFEVELESDSEDAELFFAQEGLSGGGHGSGSSLRLRTAARALRGNTSAAHASRPSARQQTNEELMEICRNFLTQLRAGTAPWVVQRLNNTYGPMPEDASSFSFWMALVLPIDEHEKAKLLPIKSPRLRLKLIVHWIEELNSNWWFSNGCVIL